MPPPKTDDRVPPEVDDVHGVHSRAVDAEARYRELLWLANHIAKQYSRLFPRHIDRDDLFASARLGLWQAVTRGAHLRPADLRNFAGARIRGEVLDCVRRQAVAGRQQTRPEMVSLSTDGARRLLPALTFEPTETSALNRAAARLTKTEREVVRLVYQDGLLASEAAALLGVSQGYTSQVLKTALAKMRRYLTRR